MKEDKPQEEEPKEHKLYINSNKKIYEKLDESEESTNDNLKEENITENITNDKSKENITNDNKSEDKLKEIKLINPNEIVVK